jgi:hypothetical protein
LICLWVPITVGRTERLGARPACRHSGKYQGLRFPRCWRSAMRDNQTSVSKGAHLKPAEGFSEYPMSGGNGLSTLAPGSRSRASSPGSAACQRSRNGVERTQDRVRISAMPNGHFGDAERSLREKPNAHFGAERSGPKTALEAGRAGGSVLWRRPRGARWQSRTASYQTAGVVAWCAVPFLASYAAQHRHVGGFERDA